MKKFIFFTIGFLLSCFNAMAVTFDIDGIRYEIISQSDRTVSVAIIPKSISYQSYSTYSGNFDIPSKVEFNGITFDVIGIGQHAFSECKNLGTITLPNSIKFIGFGAFAYSNLESITLPNGIDSIGAAAFRDCNLKEIVLPKSLRVMESTVFCRCNSLEHVQMLSNKLTSIPEVTFEDCTALKDVNIPESVASIGAYAFMNTTNLSSIHLPSKVTEIYSYCFYNSGIASINLSDGIKTIGENAFYGCKNLKSIVIPNSVTELTGQMFRGCN